MDTIIKKGLNWLTKKFAKDRNKDIKDQVIDAHFQKKYKKDIDSGLSKDEAQKRLDAREYKKWYEDNKDLGSKLWDAPEKIRKLLERIRNNNRITNRNSSPSGC